MSLSEEQRRKIEENRRRALQKLTDKKSNNRLSFGESSGVSSHVESNRTPSSLSSHGNGQNQTNLGVPSIGIQNPVLNTSNSGQKPVADSRNVQIQNNSSSNPVNNTGHNNGESSLGFGGSTSEKHGTDMVKSVHGLTKSNASETSSWIRAPNTVTKSAMSGENTGHNFGKSSHHDTDSFQGQKHTENSLHSNLHTMSSGLYKDTTSTNNHNNSSIAKNSNQNLNNNDKTLDMKTRIEQNRLRALERLQQSKISPPKHPLQSGNTSSKSAIISPRQPIQSATGPMPSTMSNTRPRSAICISPPPMKSFTYNKEITPQKVTNGSVNVWKSPDSKITNRNGTTVSNNMNGNQQKTQNNGTITSFYGKPGSNSASNVGNFSRSAFSIQHSTHTAPTSSNSTKSDNSPQINSNTSSKKLKFGSCVRGVCKLISADRFEVAVNYHPTLIEIFKTIPSKSYDMSNRKWSFLLEDHSNLGKRIEASLASCWSACESVPNYQATPTVTAARVLQSDVLIDPLPKAVLTAFGKAFKGDYSKKTVPESNLSGVDRVLVDALMPFQRVGVDFGISKGGRLLLADDMGLGKTIQAICLAAYYRDDWPLLVVTPSSVRFDWAQQIKRWMPSVKSHRISVATKSTDDCTNSDVNIVSYDIMTRRADDLKKRAFSIVIMDECHMLKNIKTARTKSAMPILQSARRAILLSGTPALSRPLELYTQIQALHPKLISYHEFGQRYCDGKQQPWGWDFSGSSNLSELQLLLENTLMIRRTKKEVLKQLPPKRRQVIQLDPASIKSTKDLQSSSQLLQLNSIKGMERRGVLLEYYHKTGQCKLTAVSDYIRDIIEGGRKLLVFAHHKEVLDSLEELVSSMLDNNYMRIDGRTSSEQRKVYCDLFQTNERVQVALLSITAANAGLNLSAAAIVIFAELFWNPGILVQAEDRVHRIGQEDSVNIHYLVAPGTADDYIWPMIQTKLEVLGKAGLAKDNFSQSHATHLKVCGVCAYFSSGPSEHILFQQAL